MRTHNMRTHNMRTHNIMGENRSGYSLMFLKREGGKRDWGWDWKAKRGKNSLLIL